MKLVDLAKEKRAEFDALKTENADLRVKSGKADALVVELEKVKGSMPSSAKIALDEYAKKKEGKKHD